LIDDPVETGTWDLDLDRYTPGGWNFDPYRRQAIESDARDFSDDIVRRMYQ